VQGYYDETNINGNQRLRDAIGQYRYYNAAAGRLAVGHHSVEGSLQKVYDNVKSMVGVNPL